MQDSHFVCGIDEAGRGPVAGPVAVAAVRVASARLPELTERFAGVKDSKKLSPQKRRAWLALIQEAADEELLSFRFSLVGAQTIDRTGIRSALAQGVRTNLTRLSCEGGDEILLDGGLYAPRKFLRQRSITKGDETEPIITLASIVAKVNRDEKMELLGKHYPEYSFEQHKGYGTHEHLKRIKKHGMSPAHRRSFLTKHKVREAPKS